jgi:ABC-type polysaccharide/polyol phosphate export permease
VLRTVFERRDLVWAFARRDLSVRYRSSALGWLWSHVQPVANLVFFSVVFLVIFKVQAPPLGRGDGGSSYPAFLLCGLVAWNLFAGLQRLSIDTLRSCASLLGKVSFPGWAPVVGAQLVQTLQVLMEFAVLALFLILLGNVGWTWLLAIPILGGTVLFGMGIGLMVSVFNAHVGDVREVVATVLTVLYFATPVLYPMSMVKGGNPLLTLVVVTNPLSWYVQATHDVMYSLVAPPALVTFGLLAGGVATLWLGLAIFARSSRDLVEVM